MEAPWPHVDPARLRWLKSARHEVALSAPECDAVAALARNYPPAPAKVGDPAYASRRRSVVRRIVQEPRSEALFGHLEALGNSLNEQHFGFDLETLLAPDYHEYDASFGHFDWHDDYAYVAARLVRKLTIVVQLSDPSEYTGGGLEVFAEGAIELPRERGAVFAFPSFVPHRVKPVESGVRRSLVAWFAGPIFR